MKRLVRAVAVLALCVGVSRPAWGQIGATPADAGVIGAPAAGAAVAPVAAPLGAPLAAPQPTTLWSFLGLSRQNLAACKEKYCQSQLSLLVRNSLAPVRSLSGGLLPQCCPDIPSAADLAKKKEAGLLSPAEEAAAKIKADEAQAKARRAAIRYLGTVDCHYFPEAEKALIAGLLNDRNECVRLEAALALGHGCCCTKRTVEALQIAATGSDKLGNPGETSERVKAAAFAALQRCAVRQKPVEPRPPETPPETIRPPELPEVEQAGLVTRSAPVTPNVQPAAPEPIEAAAVPGVPPTGRRNLLAIIRQATGAPDHPQPVEVRVQRPVSVRVPAPSAERPADVQVLPAVHLSAVPNG